MSGYIYMMSGFDPLRLGWSLIHFLWQGIGIALVLEVTLRLVGSKNASLRYLLCGLALAAMPVCLVDTYLTLGQESYAVAPHAAPIVGAAIAAPASPSEAGSFALLPGVHTISDFTGYEFPSFDLNGWLPGIVFCWLAGVVILTVRKVGGFLVLRRLRREAIFEPSDAMCQLCRNACEKIGVDPRRVYLGISELVEVPMTMGWLRPVILFPAALLSGLSTGEIELLLAHELAHIRRCDYLVNLVQTMVETLFFYHPVTWWISRRMRQERENCCDDLVAAHTSEVAAYANVLFRLEMLRQPAGGSLAAAANGGSLLERIQRLAEEPVPRSEMASPVLLSVVLMLVAIAAASMVKAQSDTTSSAGVGLLAGGKSFAATSTTNAATSLADLTVSSKQSIVYEDHFERKGDLDGSTPSVVNTGSAVWTSSTGANQYTTRGDAAAMTNSAYGYSIAYLPVNGTSGVTLDGTKDFTLSVMVTSGATGRTGISLNKGPLTRYSNLFTDEFATLTSSSAFAGAYAFNGGNIGYNYAPGITGLTKLSLAYNASAHTLVYTAGNTVVYTQTGVTAEQVSAIRYVGLGNDGYGGNAASPAPTFNNFTFAVEDAPNQNTASARLKKWAASLQASL
jgi:beta-lactamase regulating signal transducer with metallopeptidase domain